MTHAGPLTSADLRSPFVVSGLVLAAVLLFSAPLPALAQSYQFLDRIPEAPGDAIDDARSAARAPDGTMWIADEDDGLLRPYDSTGVAREPVRHLQLRTGTVELDEPYDLHFASDGTMYVADRGERAVYVVRDDPKASYRMGRKGGDLGYFDSIISLAVDEAGYVYVLDDKNDYVAVFDPSGSYLTWIRGGVTNFEDLKAVGVNRRGEVYVLQTDGPAVHILDRFGTSVYAHLRLNRDPGVSIKEPEDLAVLPNGDFLIVDRDDGVITHFSRDGTVIGTFGGDGKGSRGAFAEARGITRDAGTLNRVTILDADQKQTQRFQVPAAQDTSAYIRPQLTVRETSRRIPLYRDVAYGPDSTIYYIPQDNDESVVAVRAASMDSPLFTLRVEEAQALALDDDRTLYVLDSDERRVLAYDRFEGTLIRKFGGDTPVELDDPADVAVAQDQSVLVSDRKTGHIHRWNAQGVYQSSIPPTPQRHMEPLNIAVDSDGLIYVRDEEFNAIIRLHPEGEDLPYSNRLTLSSTDVKTPSDELRGLEIDPLDQLHVFNRATNQYAVYLWKDRPQPKLSYGRSGDDDVPHTFDDVATISFDPITYVAHVLNRDGDEVTSFQVAVRPPSPSGPVTFGASSDTLIVKAPPIDSPAVTGYGLLRKTDAGVDTLASERTPDLSLPADLGSTDAPQSYAVVYYSPTDVSAPTPFFRDYFGHGSALFAEGAYDDALAAYRVALDSMGTPDDMRRFVASRYAGLGQRLALRFENAAAHKYLEAARTLGRTVLQDADAATQTLADGYSQNYRVLAREERYDSLLTSARRVVRSLPETSAQTTITNLVDSLAGELTTLPSTSAREQAIAYYKQGIAWEAGSKADLQLKLAYAQENLYLYQKQVQAPSYERAVSLNEAVERANEAAKAQEAGSPAYHEARILYLNLLLEQEKYESVVTSTTKTLTTRTTPLSGDAEEAYRTLQAEAYLGQDKYPEALSVFQQLSADNPDDDALKIRMADVMIETGAFDDAKLIYQQMLAERNGDPRLTMKVGIVELRRGNVQEASLQLENALKADPSLIEAYGPLAEAYEAAANYTKAAEQYRAAIEALRTRIESEQGGRLGSEVKQMTADLARYLGNLGRVYEQMGSYEQAMTSYEQLTEMEPSNGDAWYGFGSASLSAGRVYQAINALNRARSLMPTSDAVSQQLARARSQRDKIAANRPPGEIVDATINPLYPSLYRNYSDPNALPIGEVVLANNTDLPMQNLRLTIFVRSLMDEPTSQDVKVLPSYTNKTVNIGAVFTPAILERTQKETFQAKITFTYQHEGRTRTVEASPQFTVFGRNAIKWADRRRLAAFVAPQDEELIDYVKSIDQMFATQPSYGLDDALVKGAQIYSILQADDLTYSVDPQTDFEIVSQDPTRLDFLQFPEETLKRKAGDCDDLVALYLGLLQNAGISTAYIDVPGHVMAAFDSGLTPDQLAASGLSPDDVIVDLGTVWIPIEATYLEDKPFTDAWREGLRRYREEQEKGNVPEVVTLEDAHKVYQPASYTLDEPMPAPPSADETDVFATYRDQVSALYADVTEARRDELERRYQSDPSNFIVANELAILYARGNQLSKAADIYRKALTEQSATPLILNNYGNVLYRQERYVRALTMYQRSIEMDDSDALVYVNLCRVHLSLGNTESARQAFQSAVEKDPSIKSAFASLESRF